MTTATWWTCFAVANVGLVVTEFAGRARAFVQVQQGCDHRCTFCVIPFGRGPNRSVPVGAVVAQVRALVERGFREVVLTGVDIASYGPDLPGRPGLGQLVRRLYIEQGLAIERELYLGAVISGTAVGCSMTFIGFLLVCYAIPCRI